MSLIYQSYLSFQTPMYTWRSAPTATAAFAVLPSTPSAPTSTTPVETTTTVEEQHNPVIHDLCLHFHRSMLITTIWNTTNLDQEIDELCHSFRFMSVHDDDKDDQQDDNDQQQYHDHDNHVATSATTATATITTIPTATASAMSVVVQNDPMMEALCAQMQSLSIHHVFQPIQKKRSSPACADCGDDDDNNGCPIPTKRQRIH